MKKQIFVSVTLIMAVFLLQNCTKQTLPEFEITEYNKVVGSCDSSICIDIHLKYHLMKDSYPASEAFNPLIENKIFSKMGYEGGETYKPKDQWVDRLLKDFDAFKTEFPDAETGGYHQDTETTITSEDEHVISILIDSYVYAGGAHGMHFREFLNVDPKTGKEIDIYDRIKNKDGFGKLVEAKLRQYLDMGPNDSWEDFTLVNEFALPANIGLTEEGMLLIYNEYEVLSYADGVIELNLGKEEIKDYYDVQN
ncbi:MAG: DUF4163 domain-containing protein [Bacteroidales bacterium]|nr:DUF4163 domain-containing protein [Bacteroidales bacterium]